MNKALERKIEAQQNKLDKLRGRQVSLELEIFAQAMKLGELL